MKPTRQTQTHNIAGADTSRATASDLVSSRLPYVEDVIVAPACKLHGLRAPFEPTYFLCVTTKLSNLEGIDMLTSKAGAVNCYHSHTVRVKTTALSIDTWRCLMPRDFAHRRQHATHAYHTHTYFFKCVYVYICTGKIWFWSIPGAEGP
jgi:hypothetical protein